MKTPRRCPWAAREPETHYHDEEWGIPVHDDRVMFEFITLEGAQAGLSWETILRKRANYRKAFDGFDPARVARYNAARVKKLLNDPGIVRNRLKIASTIANAKAFLAIQREFGSFDKYVWKFVDGAPIDGKRRRMSDLPAATKQAEALSKDLRKRGFRFVGPTITYSFMQAVGLVNDHLLDCAWHDTGRSKRARERRATSR